MHSPPPLLPSSALLSNPPPIPRWLRPLCSRPPLHLGLSHFIPFPFLVVSGTLLILVHSSCSSASPPSCSIPPCALLTPCNTTSVPSVQPLSLAARGRPRLLQHWIASTPGLKLLRLSHRRMNLPPFSRFRDRIFSSGLSSRYHILPVALSSSRFSFCIVCSRARPLDRIYADFQSTLHATADVSRRGL